MKDLEEAPFLPKKAKISFQGQRVVKILDSVLLLGSRARIQFDCGQLINLKGQMIFIEVAFHQDDFPGIDKRLKLLKDFNTPLASFALSN